MVCQLRLFFFFCNRIITLCRVQFVSAKVVQKVEKGKNKRIEMLKFEIFSFIKSEDALFPIFFSYLRAVFSYMMNRSKKNDRII